MFGLHFSWDVSVYHFFHVQLEASGLDPEHQVLQCCPWLGALGARSGPVAPGAHAEVAQAECFFGDHQKLGVVLLCFDMFYYVLMCFNVF